MAMVKKLGKLSAEELEIRRLNRQWKRIEKRLKKLPSSKKLHPSDRWMNEAKLRSAPPIEVDNE
jgi:hypothetical protein